jgi:hypothetical protein
LTINPEFVTATDLDELSERLESRELIPRLVRRLLTGTHGVEGVTLRANERIGVPGWDGEVGAAQGSAYVPAGSSAWEIGTGADPKKKAQSDYKKRTQTPLGVVPAQSVFVFVTSRCWKDKQDWVTDKVKEGVWRDVKVLDCDDLHGWLELHPGVHIWISEQLGRRPLGVETLERWAAQWSTQTDPALPLDLLLAGRAEAAQILRTTLADDAIAAGVKAGSREEALAFIAAALLIPPPPEVDTRDANGPRNREGTAEALPAEDLSTDSAASSTEQAEQAATRVADLGGAPTEVSERVDTLSGARALVVQDPVVWTRLIDSPSALVMIPATEDADIAAALAAGHHVIRPLGSGDGAGRGTLLELPSLDRGAACDALRAVFGSFDEADRRAAAARRSLVSLRRSLRRDPQRTSPPWAGPPDSEKLAPLLLAGSWRAGSADCEKIAQLSRQEYADLERLLARLAATDDPPLRLGNFEWHLSSPEDAWDLLSPQLTADDVQRWRGICVEVLSEIDPLLTLDSEARRLAAFHGEPRRHWSTTLQQGLAEGAALLGWASEQNQKIAGQRTSDWADAIVGELLDLANSDASGIRWRSLAAVLPLLAEAAPAVFLLAVENGLSGDEPVLRLMFEDGPGTSSLDTHSAHSSLLWALEGVCWSEDYLVRACAALATLEKIDPGGRLANRPHGSLRTVLLPWIPRTRANVERRLQALDAVRHVDAEIGFELILAIWPRHHDTSSASHRPRFRQWQRDPEGATYGEIFEFVSGLVPRALEDAKSDPMRWVKLVDRVTTLSEPEQEQMLSALEALDPAQLSENLQIELWRALVDLVERHRTYANAEWAMPVGLRDRLGAQATRIEPVEAVERQARLFEHRPDLAGVDRGDYEAYHEALTEVRVAAVTQALERDGLEAVRRLAAASRLPGAVGDALALATGDEYTELMLPLLEGTDVELTLASGFIRRRHFAVGPDWARDQAASLPKWPEERQVGFLRALPPGDATSVLADSATRTARERYWAEVEPFTSADEAEAFIERLLEVGRAWAAIDLVALYALEREGHEDRWRPDAELIIRVLDQALTEDPSNALQSGTTSYEIVQLLDRLEEMRTERPTLARLEWAFDPLLSYERPPRALHAELSESPDLFVELVSRLYSPDPGDEPGNETAADAASLDKQRDADPASNEHTVSTGPGKGSNRTSEGPGDAEDASASDTTEAEGFSQTAWSVLHHWRRPPGTRDDGTLDGDHLKQWVSRARKMFADRKRTRIGDSQIGELLAGAFPGEDGVWPAEPVRELVEQLESEPFDDGLYVGRMNSRGITTRGVYSGGSSERQLAVRYGKEAATLEARWPRTAQILRRLQLSYERIADQEDEEAGRRADEA